MEGTFFTEDLFAQSHHLCTESSFMHIVLFLKLATVFVIGVIIYLIFSKREANARIIENLKELFSGVKELKKQKLHLAVFFIRRMIYTFFFVCLKNISSKAIIGIITHFQIYYIFYIVINRPYKEVTHLFFLINLFTSLKIMIKFCGSQFYKGMVSLKNCIANIIEIGNEIFFFVIIGVLNLFYKEESWSSLNTGILMTLIVLNIFFISATISTQGIILLIKIIKEKRMALRNEELPTIHNNNPVIASTTEQPDIQYSQPVSTQSRPVSKISQKSIHSLKEDESEEGSKYDPSNCVNQV